MTPLSQKKDPSQRFWVNYCSLQENCILREQRDHPALQTNGAVANWIKAVTFVAVKLSNLEVKGSTHGRVKVKWDFCLKVI